MNSYQRVMNMAAGLPVDHTPAQPIFMRYIARMIDVHYRDFCLVPKVKVEGNLRLAERFGVDAVTVMSDAYAEAFDHGAELVWFADKPPAVIQPVLLEKEDLKATRLLPPSLGPRMAARLEEIRLYCEVVKGEVPVVGWVEGPMAQACIFREINTFMLETLTDPAFACDLLDRVTELEIEFARLQVRAGADIVGVGDSAASLVSPDYYAAEIAPRQKLIVDAVHSEGAIARLHICGNIDGKARAVAALGFEIIDVDHLTDLARFRKEVGYKPVLQGNVDPVNGLMRATPEEVYENFRAACEIIGPRRMVGAGCEVPPETPEENIHAMMRFAREHKCCLQS
jgi:MtaA/CmuA family methyltransferase